MVDTLHFPLFSVGAKMLFTDAFVLNGCIKRFYLEIFGLKLSCGQHISYQFAHYCLFLSW